MRHTVGDGSPHAVEPIHQFAVVVIPVPKVEDEQNNQRGHEYAHLTSLLPAAQVRQPPGRPASVCRSSVCRSCHRRFYSGLVVGSSCAWPASIGNGVAVRPRKGRPDCALRGVQTGSVAGSRGLSRQPLTITLILCKTPVCPYGPAPARPCNREKGCAVHAQPGFPTPRRKETIRRRYETAPGARRTRSAFAHQRREGKNDRRSLKVRRPSFWKNTLAGSVRSPLRLDFTCTFRAGLNHGDSRQGASPIRIMGCDALAESERQQA